MKINREDRKISLSIKRLLPDPWDQIEIKYPINTRHKALVKISLHIMLLWILSLELVEWCMLVT